MIPLPVHASLRIAVVSLSASFLAPSAVAWGANDQPETQATPNQTDEIVITEKARMHFKAGVNLLLDPEGARYEEAYQQFMAAYQESPSWKIQGNLGVAAMQLERYGEAIDAFESYLKEGGAEISEQENEQFTKDLETLKASVAYLTIKAAAGTSLTDLRSTNRGQDVKNFYLVPESGELMIGVRPGQHKISADSNGKNIGQWSFSVEAQKTMDHSFIAKEGAGPSEAPVEASDAGSNRVPAYVALGVGAVGVGVGVAFLVVRGGQKGKAQDEYDACLETGTCDQSDRIAIEDRDKNAATAGTISLISFGVGAAGIGAGLTLLLLGGGDEEKPLEAQVGSVKFSPYASSSQFGLTGTF